MDYISRTPEVGLSANDARLLFGNIEEIYQFNRFVVDRLPNVLNVRSRRLHVESSTNIQKLKMCGKKPIFDFGYR